MGLRASDRNKLRGGGYMGRFDSFLRDEEKQRGLEKKYKILISAILFSSKQTSQMNTYNWNSHSQEKQYLWARSLPWSLRSVTATQQQWRNCAIVSFYLYRINCIIDSVILRTNQSWSTSSCDRGQSDLAEHDYMGRRKCRRNKNTANSP